MTTWYLDPINGSSGNAGLGFWVCDYTSGNGTQPPVDESQTMTGGTSGKTAKLVAVTVTSGTWAGGNAAGKLYFMSKSGTFSAGETGTFTNTATCAITADLAVAARQWIGDLSAADLVAGDIIRISDGGSSYRPVSLGNATWTDDSDTVTLAAALTQTIENCEATGTGDNQWPTTPVSNVTVSLGTGYYKQGSGLIYAAIAGAFTTGKAAYAKFASLNLSSYGNISFWIYSDVAVAANSLRFDLCSDVAGDTVVDSFTIPYKLEAGRFYPISLVKDGGGSLGAAIQSVAINVLIDLGGSTVTLRVDNIIAHNGFSHQSLISKHTNGTDEPWFGIRSIDGTSVRLGGGQQDYGQVQVQYLCHPSDTTPETVESYYRNTIKTTLMTTYSATVQAIAEDATYGSPLSFQGGWDTVTGTQMGLTFFDGLNGWGFGIASNGSYRLYYIFNRIGVVRYYSGLGGGNFKESIFQNCHSILSSATNFYLASTMTIEMCFSIGGFSTFEGYGKWTGGRLIGLSNVAPIRPSGVMRMINCVIGCVEPTYGLIYLSSLNCFLYLYNCKVSCDILAKSSYQFYPKINYVMSINHNCVSGAVKVALFYGNGSYDCWYTDKDTTIYRGASGASLKITPAHATLKAESAPVNEGVEVAVDASGDFTISCYVRKSHTSAGDSATYNGNAPRIILRQNGEIGITADTVIATHPGGESAGDWVQLSGSLSGASIVPSQAGVCEFIVDCDGTAGFINIDDWAVT